MPVEKLTHYKKSMKLRFGDELMEQKFLTFQHNRGRSTAIYSLASLAIINFTFAFLEYWILGIESQGPLLSYIFIAFVCVGLTVFSVVSSQTNMLKMRIIVPGLLTLMILIWALYLPNYRLYHAIEIILLVVWMGSLNVLRFRQSFLLSLSAGSAFIIAAYFAGAVSTKLIGLIALMIAAFALALYLCYMMERFRRTMFLTNEALKNVYERQENWAYTLIDLDMSLSGILDIRELVSRLMEHFKTVIEYDSFVMTSLDGKGPKPAADEVEGALFEDDDQTIWSDELIMRLSQTRQAKVSAEFTEAKSFFGKGKKNFQYFRMDIPVFNDSNLVAVVSLKRESQAFDDLDMTASVSIATQAMMIFNRTAKASLMSAGLQQVAASKPDASKPADPKSVALEEDKESSSPSTDIELTDVQAAVSHTAERDETVVPSAVVKQIKKDTETARKTITLLSRENAEHVSMDRYRTAAVENEPLSLLLVEVDGLSSIREKEGDQSAYKIFAGIVKYVFSKTDKERDVLGRYGQNGFSILLPRVDMNAAEKFAESLRYYTEKTSFKTAFGDRRATLSIGVAAITDETGNHESMVKRADMALFVAKKNGRNCVKVRL